MRSSRYKQLDKAQNLNRKGVRKKFVQTIKDKNENIFIHPLCSGCGNPLDLGDEYSFTHGFCSVNCGMITFGLSYSDFY